MERKMELHLKVSEKKNKKQKAIGAVKLWWLKKCAIIYVIHTNAYERNIILV